MHDHFERAPPEDGVKRRRVPDVPDASGYHDPVTTRFIDATALVRKREKIADECFLRRALG